MKYTNEQINTMYRSLPLDIREVIASVEYMDKVQAVGKKYKLMIDKTGALSEETGFVLMGLTPSKDFTKNIRERLEVSEDVALNIVNEINEQIFFAVRESLKKIFEERDAEGSSLLGGSLLEEKGSFLGKKEEEEMPSREDILREIEDKEHHNLPAVNKSELHLEAKLPSGIVKREKPAEMILIRPEQPQKESATPQAEAMKTMKGDILKSKMSGTVNLPKETIEISGSATPAKVKLPDVGKIDPYRERTA